MVISVLSSQDTEFLKEHPSPVHSFVVDDVTKMVDITPPKGKKRPCKLAVMKYKRASKLNVVTTTLNPV